MKHGMQDKDQDGLDRPSNRSRGMLRRGMSMKMKNMGGSGSSGTGEVVDPVQDFLYSLGMDVTNPLEAVEDPNIHPEDLLENESTIARLTAANTRMFPPAPLNMLNKQQSARLDTSGTFTFAPGPELRRPHSIEEIDMLAGEWLWLLMWEKRIFIESAVLDR